ncbi:hypothetical protein AcV5_000237 [Taiwanofungus camphoratus]|nr:hypothetical protein AcV5_000237 [Antrodia cinnamomea]
MEKKRRIRYSPCAPKARCPTTSQQAKHHFVALTISRFWPGGKRGTGQHPAGQRVQDGLDTPASPLLSHPSPMQDIIFGDGSLQA